MAKKSSFWSNFWGETGRNTGKWVSNKVFGNTGWATPRRHLHGDGKNTKYNNDSIFNVNLAKGKNGNIYDFDLDLNKKVEHDWGQARIENILEMVSEIDFNTNNVDENCTKLDDLFVGLYKAMELEVSIDMFLVKIRSGIARLRRAGAGEIADFYLSELKILNKKKNRKIWGIIILVIICLLLITLPLIIDHFTDGEFLKPPEFKWPF